MSKNSQFDRHKPTFFALAWGVILAISGAQATLLDSWYFNLVQPAWKPPDWLFGPMWSTIFICAGIAFVLAWNRGPSKQALRYLIILYIVNGTFNLVWSLIYFRLHRPDWALIEAFGLWASVLAIILAVRSYSIKSAWLMSPYLIWVSIAIVLNWETVKLNGPFS
jgi:tryptophan-rich sensory protein